MSGLKGAYLNKASRRRPWRSSITMNGKERYLGSFATAEEAHGAYCIAMTKYHGTFAEASLQAKAADLQELAGLDLEGQ